MVFGWLPLTLQAEGSAEARHQAVLGLEPVGYWPADIGSGSVLRDLSKTKNDGEIVYVPWDGAKNLLNFTGAYQWLQIPANKVYQTETFSLGGWVFLRSEVIGSGWPNRQGTLFFGNEDWLNAVGIQLCIRRQELIDVVSDGEEDVLGTRLWVGDVDGKRIRKGQGEPSLGLGKWHHLVYTFEPKPEQAEVLNAPNLVEQAKVTASNDGGHRIRSINNLTDGKLETQWVFWPGAGPRQDSEKWVRLDFAKPTKVNRIRLVGRLGKTDYFAEGVIYFSDGSTMKVPSLRDGWDVMFPDKTITWMRYEASRVVGPRPGLAEMSVYRVPKTVYEEEGIVEYPVIGLGIVGQGTLYLNGKEIKRNDKVVYRPSKRRLQIGNDANWWHQQSGKSGSLDGSVRDMVWFDRALSSREVSRLHKVTKPSETPNTFADHSILVGRSEFKRHRLGGREVQLTDWNKLTVEERREVLELATEKGSAFWKTHADVLELILPIALVDPSTRLAASRLLLSLPKSEQFHSLSLGTIALCAESISDKKLSKEQRAESALALAEFGSTARDALPKIESALQNLLVNGASGFPKVEDHLRNALTWALLKIGPDSREAAKLLGTSYLLPYLGLIEAPASSLTKIKSMLEEGQAKEAIKEVRRMSKHDTARPFFTQRDTGPKGDYTGTADRDGILYKVGTGIAWEGVERISPEDYRQVVSRRAKDHPSATKWRPDTFEHLYRVPISKTTPDGKTETIYLEGEDFVLDGHDAKVRGWSILIDDQGYIHLMGGQHNAPNQDYFIPGSWEQMGLSRDRKSPDYPAQMYWVSSKPGDINTLEFAGKRNDPRAVPADYLNYLVFLQNKEGVTYLYGRSSAHGFQSWGMFRYDSEEKRWAPVGGDPYVITEAIQQIDSDWLGRTRDNVRGIMPSKPSEFRPLAWAWQPAFYNFCRDNWGARFDATGRLHLHLQISGLNQEGYNGLSGLYAWSDDLGATFYRADGSQVVLPLTINPSPKNHAGVYLSDHLQWWNLWMGLLTELGVKSPRPSAL